MRLTTKNARIDKDAKHNDRNFDLSLASHINPELTKENKYYTYNGDTEKSFLQIEKEFYQEHFSAHLKAQNERNTAAGHKSRNKTMNQYRKAQFSSPEDRILQIGKMGEHATPEELWACALDYAERFNELSEGRCVILNMALHVDEATPHVHIRRVWIATDKDGHEYVSQSGALRELGHGARINRHENGTVSFTRVDRELFSEVCREHGLDIDVKNPQKRPSLSVKEYKEAMQELERMEQRVESLQEKAKEIEKENDAKCDEISQKIIETLEASQYAFDKHFAEIQEANKKDRQKRAYALMDILEHEVKSIYGDAKTRKEFEQAIQEERRKQRERNAESFIASKGLTSEYNNYMKRRRIDMDKLEEGDERSR